MPINGKPLLSIWLDRLVDADFGPFIINSHHLSEKIEEFVINNKHSKKIKYVFEERILGTAGTLINNIEFLNDGGLLAHADNFCLADFKKFYLTHQVRPKSCLMTMMTFSTSSPGSCGIVEIDNNNIVKKFYEKDPDAKGTIANGAIYLLSKEMIEIIKSNYSKCTDFSTEIIPEFVNKIFTYHTNEILIDIGTNEDYLKAIEIDKKNQNYEKNQ